MMKKRRQYYLGDGIPCNRVYFIVSGEINVYLMKYVV